MSQAILKKIAELSGVSVTTAHRALSGHPYVKEVVKKKILKAAATLNYTPPQAAKKTQIAVLVSSNSEPYLSLYRSNILGMLLAACGKRGFGVEAVMSDNLEILDEHFLRTAVIFQSTFEVDLLKKYKNTSFFSMNSMHQKFPGVATDEAQIIRMGLSYLYEHGHRKIAAAVPVSKNDPVIDLRLQIYNEFCAEKNLDYRNVLHVMPQSYEHDSWINSLNAPGKPDALFSMGEDILLSIHHALSQHKINIPEDISLISLESDVAGFLTPAITTVAQDFPSIIEETLNCIENAPAKKSSLEKTHKLIAGKLIERASVQKQ